jgi:hypothetical protein
VAGQISVLRSHRLRRQTGAGRQKPKNVRFRRQWGQSRSAAVSGHSHSGKLISKIKTPETRRIRGFRCSNCPAAKLLPTKIGLSSHPTVAVARVGPTHRRLLQRHDSARLFFPCKGVKVPRRTDVERVVRDGRRGRDSFAQGRIRRHHFGSSRARLSARLSDHDKECDARR